MTNPKIQIHITEITVRVKTTKPLDPSNLPTVYHLIKNEMVGDAEWVKLGDAWLETVRHHG